MEDRHTIKIKIGTNTYLFDPQDGDLAERLSTTENGNVAAAMFQRLTGRHPAPGDIVAHHNHNSRDFRRSNISTSQRSVRCQEPFQLGRQRRAGGIERLKNGKYRVRVSLRGKRYSLGIHGDEQDAIRARDAFFNEES